MVKNFTTKAVVEFYSENTMKKYLLLISMMIVAQTVYAYDTAKLQLNIAGQIKNNDYLCINNMGCFAMGPGSHGHTFAIDLEDIRAFALLNLQTRRAYVQALPDSCKISPTKDQTIVISGKMQRDSERLMINQLHCALV